MYARFFKRILDVIIGLIALIILLLPMLIIAAAVKLDDPRGTVFFKQTRIGRNGTSFKILKFRSMDADTPKHLPSQMFSAEDYEKHVTRIGRILRRTSLDELPQVFNIIAGDMSWVGPRPVLAKEKELTDARNAAGLSSFRPGLTGWAQINGRNTLTDEEKARYDAEYAHKISFLFDMYCMLKTAKIVVTKKGFQEGTNKQYDPSVDFEASDEFSMQYDASITGDIGIRTTSEPGDTEKEPTYAGK